MNSERIRPGVTSSWVIYLSPSNQWLKQDARRATCSIHFHSSCLVPQFTTRLRMKLSLPLLVLIAAFSAPSWSQAAECTDAERVSANNVASDPGFSTACPVRDATACSNAQCMEYTKQLVLSIPNCTIDGFPARDAVNSLLALCQQSAFGPIDTTSSEDGSVGSSSGSGGGNEVGSRVSSSEPSVGDKVTTAPLIPKPTESSANQVRGLTSIAAASAASILLLSTM